MREKMKFDGSRSDALMQWGASRPVQEKLLVRGTLRFIAGAGVGVSSVPAKLIPYVGYFVSPLLESFGRNQMVEGCRDFWRGTWM